MQLILTSQGILDAMSEKISAQRGKRLKALREAAGLSQRELAERLTVHHSNIGFWESGAVPPRSEVLPAMADIFGVRVEELLGHEAKRKVVAAPSGRARLVFDKVSKLPKRQQQKILEVVEAFVAQHGNGHSKSA
jgi:transcriptional regulator with XRE-family HTH domain